MTASPLRVAGADPGTSSLDLLVLQDGAVADQCRFSPDQLAADPAQPVRWLEERGPFALIAGPSGYGLSLVRSRDVTEDHLALLSLVRPDERGRSQGVTGFTALVRALCVSSLPVVFLPGVVHLPTVPRHRKINRIDLGTPDKLCVAALALAQRPSESDTFCVVELGSAFTACTVVAGGKIVDGIGGTAGPIGWRGGGAWDGEVAYLLSPLSKSDLFAGGAVAHPPEVGRPLFRESLLKTVAGMHAIAPFPDVILSGRLLEIEPELIAEVEPDLSRFGRIQRLRGLAGAWVKHAAQGAAVLADGLAGGRYVSVVESLSLRGATGSVLDNLAQPRAETLRGREPTATGEHPSG